MGGLADCDSVVTAGRLSNAIEFFDAAEHLGEAAKRAVAARGSERQRDRWKR